MINLSDNYLSVIDDFEDLAILFLDTEGNVNFWNKAAEKLKGYKEEEIIGKNFSIFFTNDDCNKQLPEIILRDAISNKKTSYEGWRVRKDGTQFWGSITLVVIYDKQNRHTGFSKIVRDLSIQKQSEDLRQMIIESALDAIISVDCDGLITDWNPKAEEIFGWNKNEIIGKNLAETIIPPQLREKHDAKFYNHSHLNDSTFINQHKHTTAIRKDGTEFPIELTIIPINQNGKKSFCAFIRDITEQKLAEAHLIESIKEVSDYKHALDKSSIIAVTDTNGIIKYANDNFINIAKFEREEILGRNHNIFSSGHHTKEFYANLWSTISSGKVWQGEIKNRAKDGSYHWLFTTIVPFLDERGNPIQYVAIRNDITERKNNEEKIRLNELKFSSLIQNSADAILILLPNGKPIYVTPSIKTVLGYHVEDVLETDIYSLLHPDFIEKFQSLIIEVLANESHPLQLDYFKIRHHDNTWRWINGTITSLVKDQSIGGLVLNFRDVTDKVVSREEIEKKEKYFRALIENSSDIIVLTDKDRKITYISPACEKATGYTLQEAIGKYGLSFMHPEQVEESKYIYEKSLQNPGITIPRTNRLLTKKGKYIWVEGTLINLLNDESVKAVVTNYREITEQKIAEQKILNLNRVYALISEINQTIVHIKDEQTLFKETCRIAIDIGNFKMAWIGIVDEKTNNVIPIHFAGYENEYLKQIKTISIENIPEGRGPTGTALRENRSVVCNDIEYEPYMAIWAEQALKRGYKSSISLPIKKLGKPIAVFTIYASVINYFIEEEINLLEEVAGDISFAIDVFEKERIRIQIEDRLKQSELGLKQAQSIAHVGTWELDLKTGITLWSDEACKIYGLPPGICNLSYNDWLAFIHPDDLVNVLNIITEARKSWLNTSFYHRIKRTDGSIRHIHTQSHYTFDSDGGLPKIMFGVIHDLTEIKIADEALIQSEANLRIVIDLIPHAIFVRDKDGRYLLANKIYASLFGLEPKDIINKTRKEFVKHISNTEYLSEIDKEVISVGITRKLPEVVFTDFEGNVKIFNTIKAPFIPVGKNQNALLNISNDITLQKQVEAELNKVIADVVQRNKDLEQFSYIISHNLRSPVANIIGLIEVLRLSDNSIEENVYIQDELFESINKLDSVIKDINNILKVKREINELKEVVNFKEILDDIKLSINNQIISNKVEVISNFDDFNEMVTIKSYLYSIFYNLITNSIKYRQPNKNPVIEICGKKLANTAKIIFSDNGLGIDLNKSKEQIFGLYKRFHFHTEGKGMGLYMVKTQIESLGGVIKVESEVNVGTKFIIEFEN